MHLQVCFYIILFTAFLPDKDVASQTGEICLNAVVDADRRFGKTGNNDSLAVEIAARVNLPEQRSKTFLLCSFGVELHAAALDEAAAVNGFGVNNVHIKMLLSAGWWLIQGHNNGLSA